MSLRSLRLRHPPQRPQSCDVPATASASLAFSAEPWISRRAFALVGSYRLCPLEDDRLSVERSLS